MQVQPQKEVNSTPSPLTTSMRRFWHLLTRILAVALILLALSTPAISQTSSSDGLNAPSTEASPQPQTNDSDSAETNSNADRNEDEDRAAWAIVDGKPLFEVAEVSQFPADERAKFINDKLEKAAESPGVEVVTIGERNGLPTIDIDDDYLITVTQKDAELGEASTPEEQAEIWAREIRLALRQASAERSEQFLRWALVKVTLIFMLTLMLHWWIQRIAQRFGGDSPTAVGWRSLVVAAARLLLWSATALYISHLFPLTRQWIYDLRQVLTYSVTAPILPVDDDTYSLVDILILLALLLGLVIGANRLSQLLKLRVLQVSRLNRAAQDAIATTIKYTFMVVGTVVVFNIWGLDITSLTILAGALSVGIGFGLQDIAKNLGSGIVLLFERPIQVGDFVEVGEYVGTVERIGSRSTLIRTLDRVSIIVPNSRFLETEVINWSHDNPVSRLRLPVGVAYGSDLAAVKSALLEAGRQHPQVLRIPPPRVLFVGFGDSSLDFELLVWCADPSQQYLLKSDLYFAVEAQLNAAGVEIPFPQRDLHVRSGALPISLSADLERMLARLLERLGK
jgi:small-conductance mechanosensitive channel